MVGPARGLVVAALLACIGAADAPRGFAVAVLRRDGMLIPFATFDGKNWRNPWPTPQLELTVPINVASIPPRWWGTPGPREAWQAWIDGTPQSIRVVQPDWVDARCVRYITLRTDYRSTLPTPDRSSQPYPKDGLAVSPPQRIDRVEILSTSGPEARELAPALLEAFNRMERTTESNHGHPIARRKRETIEPDIDALYAFGDSPRTYYVEALRTYRLLGQSPGECTAVGFGTGWMIQDAHAIRPLLMTVDVLDCERRDASYMLPLGAMRIGSRLFWFAQFSGWDHERYTVIEVTPKRVDAVVNTWGGGC
jgi:hypothetical protein